MPIWRLTCQHCGTPNEIASKQMAIDCGKVSRFCD